MINRSNTYLLYGEFSLFLIYIFTILSATWQGPCYFSLDPVCMVEFFVFTVQHYSMGFNGIYNG